jgi:hypothetical protein
MAFAAIAGVHEIDESSAQPLRYGPRVWYPEQGTSGTGAGRGGRQRSLPPRSVINGSQ